MGRERDVYIGISPHNDHDRDPNLVRPSHCTFTTKTFFFPKNELGAMPHASGLQRCNSEHTCFGQGRAWINSIQCLATNFQPFRQLMLVVTFRQQALSLAFILDSLR
jgi:hypothetical protein